MSEEERKEYIRKTTSHSFWLWVEGKMVMNTYEKLDIQNAKNSVGKLLPMYDEEGNRKIPTTKEGMRKLEEDREKRIEQVKEEWKRRKEMITPQEYAVYLFNRSQGHDIFLGIKTGRKIRKLRRYRAK